MVDFLFALSYIPGFWIRQNNTLCVAQGFVIAMTTAASLYWTMIITHIMYMSTVKGRSRA